MSRQQIKERLEAAGFEVSEELVNTGYELAELKEEGKALPDTREALEAFTQKWRCFCVTHALWLIADQIGHRAGLWA